MRKLDNLVNNLDKNKFVLLKNCKHKVLFHGIISEIPTKYLSWLVLDLKGLFLRKNYLTIIIVEDIEE